MNPVCILALDPGHKLGFCVDGEEPRQPISGVCELPRAYPDNGRAWAFLETWLALTIEQYGVTVLAWEAPIVFGGNTGGKMRTNNHAIEFAYGVGSICELVGFRHKLTCWKAPISTVRKHFTGSGRSDKGQVYARCLALGYAVTSHDAADATAIWDFAGHIYRRSQMIPGPLFTEPSHVRSMRRAAPSLAEESDAED